MFSVNPAGRRLISLHVVMSSCAPDFRDRHLLSAEGCQQVADAIARAESRTSAELKVIVIRHCWDNLRRKAHDLFLKHCLDRTRDRNAVLILVVSANREVLVYGDQGIHQHVGDVFWQQTCDEIVTHFREGHFTQGLVAGIERISASLSEHFPYRADDRNELANGVTFDG